MKKILLSIIMIGACTTLTAQAKIGDKIQPIYSTDIMTVVDGVPIQGYAINGQMLIALEDLCDYGFTVNYIDSVRTVYIDKTYEISPEYLPDIPRGKVGEISGYTLETDIKAYVNGKFINTQAIDGKVVAVAEELAAEITWENSGLSEYGMTYTYDNDTLTLYLFTTPCEPYNFPEPDWGAVSAERNAMSSEKDFELYAGVSADRAPYYGAKFEPKSGVYLGMTADSASEFDPLGGYLTYLNGMKDTTLFHPADYMMAERNVITTVAWNMTNMNINYTEVKKALETLSSYNKPILIRFAGEMSEDELGEDPERYVKMFRRVSDLVHQYENLAIVWSPLDLGNLKRNYDYYYPGDEYVDWVGVSCYDIKYFQGEKNRDESLLEFFLIGDRAWATNRIKLFMKYLKEKNINKPVMLSECGVATENQYNEDLTDWAMPRLRNMLWSVIMKYPEIKLINYFNVRTEEKQTFYISDKPYASEIFKEASKEGIFLNSADDTAEYVYNKATEAGKINADANGNVILYMLVFLPDDPVPTVTYIIDNNDVATAVEIPYKFPLNISGMTDGRHILTVTAGDMNKTYTFTKSGNTVDFQ